VFAGFDFVTLFDGTTDFDADGNAQSHVNGSDFRNYLVQLHGQDIPAPWEASGPDMLFQLTSDSSVSGDGFLAHFMCVEPGSTPAPPPDACTTGETYTDTGILDKSEGYGTRHDCRWLLVCSDTRLRARVMFTQFDLEAGFDYVRLFDGDATGTATLGEFHGQELPYPTEASGPQMMVQLTTDGSVSGEGFLANFDCVRPGTTPPPPQTPCTTGVQLDDSGQVNKTGEYDRNHDCRWALRCSNPAMRPLLSFSVFDLEAGYDFVRLFDGSEPSESPLFEFHGQDIPPPTEGPHNMMLLQLTSDASVSGDGFVAMFDCVPAGSTPIPPPDACTTGLNLDDSGIIDKTGGYSHRHDCRWLIHCSQNEHLVPAFTFSSFDLETGPSS
jgi:hypothetical protein